MMGYKLRAKAALTNDASMKLVYTFLFDRSVKQNLDHDRARRLNFISRKKSTTSPEDLQFNAKHFHTMQCLTIRNVAATTKRFRERVELVSR